MRSRVVSTFVLSALFLLALFGEASAEVLSGAAGADSVLGETVLALHQAMEWNDPSALPTSVGDWSSLVLPAIEKAVDALSAELGQEIST